MIDLLSIKSIKNHDKGWMPRIPAASAMENLQDRHTCIVQHVGETGVTWAPCSLERDSFLVLHSMTTNSGMWLA